MKVSSLKLGVALWCGMGAVALANPLSIMEGNYQKGSTKYSTGRHVDVDQHGRIHAVFTQSTDTRSGNPGEYVWSDDNGATWQVGLSDLDQGSIENTSWGNFTPSIRVGSDDSVHIVWYQAFKDAKYKDIFYSVSHDRGATFTKPVAITEKMASSSYVWPSIALDNANHAHVVFSDPFGTRNIFYVGQNTEGQWGAPIAISESASPKDTAGIEFNKNLGANGALFAFWDSGSTTVGKAFVNRSDDNGKTWSGVSTVITTGGRVLWPSMTFDEQGNAYMSITLNSSSAFKIIVIKRDTDGNWSKPDVDTLFPPSQVKGYMRSNITIDQDSKLTVFVEGTAASRKNWNIWSISASSKDLNTWTNVRRVSDSADGDNAFVSVPAVTKTAGFIPTIWTHGDIADSETGHLSSELPGNSKTSVMFSNF